MAINMMMKVKPPVRTHVIFHKEQNSTCPCDERKRSLPDPDTHPLFGIPLKNPHWPGYSEYHDKYCYGAGQKVSASRQWGQHKAEEFRDQASMSCLPWPCGPQIAGRNRDNGQAEYGRASGDKSGQSQQRFDELYDPTPLPALEKRYRGYYYRIDDPIGQVITPEEVTKCRETVFGPVAIRTQDEISDIYVPNYRYKEWATQPQFDILKQNEMTGPLCRMPEVDSRFYDFYHNVRMDRPTPLRPGHIFGTCAVIPLPRNDAEFAVRQMLL